MVRPTYAADWPSSSWTASFGFLPSIGSSISFRLVAFGFFEDLAGWAWPTLRRSTCIKSTMLPAAGRL